MSICGRGCQVVAEVVVAMVIVLREELMLAMVQVVVQGPAVVLVLITFLHWLDVVRLKQIIELEKIVLTRNKRVCFQKVRENDEWEMYYCSETWV